MTAEGAPRDDKEKENWECLSCGAINPNHYRFCGSCGAPQIVPLGAIQTLEPAELLRRFGPKGGSLIAKRYRLIEQIGSGSTGAVFRAVDVNLDRIVAIKVLSSSPTDGMDVNTRLLRLQTEGRVLGRLRHQGLVTIFDMGDEAGVVYIVMEFVEGETLKSRLTSGKPMPINEAVDIIVQVCDAIRHAHRHGVVHRDLKPSNIMLTEGNRVKVTDFGFAKVAFGSKVAEAGIIIGTPYYMSPEQLMGKDVDHRSDIFSTGITLYEMVSGRKPFDGRNLQEIVRAILSGGYVKPRQRNLELPMEVEVAIEKALIKNRDLRYQSIDEFSEDLKAWRDGTQFAKPSLGHLSLDDHASEKPHGLGPAQKASITIVLLAFAALLVAVTMLLIHVHSSEYALNSSARALLEDFRMHRFGRVYDRLSDDFKWRYGMQDFADLPYIGFKKTANPEEMLCTVEKTVMLEDGREANVLVSIKYAGTDTTLRYTMRWVKAEDYWFYSNPDYEAFRKEVLGPGR